MSLDGVKSIADDYLPTKKKIRKSDEMPKLKKHLMHIKHKPFYYEYPFEAFFFLHTSTEDTKTIINFSSTATT